jgi:hypothetical protein
MRLARMDGPGDSVASHATLGFPDGATLVRRIVAVRGTSGPLCTVWDAASTLQTRTEGSGSRTEGGTSDPGGRWSPRGAYPCRIRQISWWGFGGGVTRPETDENARVFAVFAEVP